MELVVHSKKPLFQQKFEKKLYHFNRNSHFRSAKMIQLDIWSQSWTQNPTLTPSIVRNLTLTLPKNLCLLMTSTPQPCLQQHTSCPKHHIVKNKA